MEEKENVVTNNSSTPDPKNVSANKDNNGNGDISKQQRRFIGWSPFKRTDKDKPDVLELKSQTKEIWSTKYSKCTNVSYNLDGVWSDAILPLKALNSDSPGIIKQWTETVESGQIKVGEAVKILTWLDKSINNHPIRRFKLVT
jgi:hypothetical protein